MRTMAARYTDEEILQAIRDLADRLGRTPKRLEFDELGNSCTSMTVLNRFGSWSKGCEAAGVDVPRKGPVVDDDQTREMVLAAERDGLTLVQIGERYGLHHTTVSLRIVSYLERHGLPPLDPSRNARSSTMASREDEQMADETRKLRAPQRKRPQGLRKLK